MSYVAQFKEGDKITLKSWDELVKEFSLDSDGDITLGEGWHISQVDKELIKGVLIIKEHDSSDDTYLLSNEDDTDDMWVPGSALPRMIAKTPVRAEVHFKPGDRVRVRQWSDMSIQFGLGSDGDIEATGHFSKKMQPLCGQIAIVTSVERCWINLKFENPNADSLTSRPTRNWTWSSDMLEHCIEESKKEPLYKKGDRVKFKSWDDLRAMRSVFYGFNSGMRHLCGVEATVEECGTISLETSREVYDLRLKFDISVPRTYWSYSTDMVEPVKEHEEPKVFYPEAKVHEGIIAKPCGEVFTTSDTHFGHSHIPINMPIKLTSLKVREERKGESTMRNISVLARMADQSLRADLEAASLAGLPKNIMEALKEKQEEEQKEAAKNAASVIIDLVKKNDSHIEAHVRQIRELRRQEAQLKAQLDALSRAKDYGFETSNFLPLAVLTGTPKHFFDVEDKSLFEVPKDWKPKAKAEEAK